MNKVPLYTLEPGEKFKLENKVMRVTATKNIHKEGSHSFQQIYCVAVSVGNFLNAPAGLMVEKIE